jgi:SAM-dependent methyltransferase
MLQNIHNKLRKIFENNLFYPTLFSLMFNPYYIIRKYLYQSIKKYSNKINGNILDFGCGTKPYKNLFSYTNYLGIDLVSNYSDKKNQDADIHIKDLPLPFENSSFDSIIATEVLEHVFDIDKLFSEFNRVLKNDGTVLITVPFIWHEHEIPYDYARYTSFALKHLAKKHGFEVEIALKTTGSLLTILQLINALFYSLMFKFKLVFILRLVLTFIFIFPINFISILFSFLKSSNPTYYLNNILILIKKDVIS